MFIFTLSPLALFSCAKPSIDMPKSPFEDSYTRIGMKGEFDITDTMPQKDYNEIKKYVSEGEDDKVTHYIRQEESRDLKYAYFGQESSTISQCSMASINESGFRYPNKVTISSNITDQQIQSANSGIIKTSASSSDYSFDDTYPHNEMTYSLRRVKKNNDESAVVTEPIKEKTYSEGQLESIFGLTPFVSRIKSHFLPSTIRDIQYEFKLLGDNNKAIYGMSGDKYLIKEGYSIFPDFKTTMGRTYKAEDNFFYEGLLEKYEVASGNEVTYAYRFTNFRFYHELLILSKAFDGTGVPILYLDKPVLIEYSEVKYEISYDALSNYSGNIPDVTTPTNK